MHTVEALRAGRFSPDHLTRALLVDVGVGPLIVALEKYCGVFVTRWLLRMVAFFIPLTIIHHSLLWGFGIPLHEVIAAAATIAIPDTGDELSNVVILRATI